MGEPPVFTARALDPADLSEARAVAARAGVHGVYLGNSLTDGYTTGDGGELVGFYGEQRLLGLAFFGARGNLIVVEDEPLDGEAVATGIDHCQHSWRIALAPELVVAALARREVRSPLVQREQLYYGVRPADVVRDLLRDDVRPAQRRDYGALLSAALDLNEVDLHVDRRRVHKAWLRESIKRRVRNGHTLVIESHGVVMSKLDIGSQGSYGMMVEGVYTAPHARGRKLAAGLVATVAVGSDAPLVCLHVAADNEPAKRAYQRAGMTVMGSCGLLLRY